MNSGHFSAILALLAVSSAAGCAPLTFSEKSAIDFERYSSVSVAVTSNVNGPEVASGYLAQELRDHSGFESVTTAAGATADLRLEVRITTSPVTVSDSDIEYDGRADYTAFDASNNAVIDSGSEDDTSETAWEAEEDVLDEVALHFIAPFRL